MPDILFRHLRLPFLVLVVQLPFWPLVPFLFWVVPFLFLVVRLPCWPLVQHHFSFGLPLLPFHVPWHLLQYQVSFGLHPLSVSACASSSSLSSGACFFYQIYTLSNITYKTIVYQWSDIRQSMRQ